MIAGVVVIALAVILTAQDKYPEDIIVIKESEQTCNPDSLSVVTQMKVVTLPAGNSPHVFKCRGFRDGWYEISGGFVQAQYMNWDAIDTF